VTYQSSITSDGNGPLDLKMELNYDNSNTAMPIAVVMHQFSQASGNFADYRANAQRLRDQGFFVLTVAMRGRDGSDGVRDSGGLEIYDIHDAVEYAKSTYGSLVDASNISITGYSGGGGNVLSAVTKFPDYFRAASSFFGMSDYGYDATNGWYNNGASSSHRAILNTDIGNPNTGGATVRDRYMARDSALASQNNPYTEIHLFVNGNEPVTPPVNDTTFKNNAVANASHDGEFDNITVHIGLVGTYHDFDNDSVNDPNEQQYWPHGDPTADQQAAAEQWYLSRLLSGDIPEPVLNGSDTLFVAGFVKTKAFEAWLGDGQNAAGLLEYQMTPGRFEFTLDLLSSDSNATGWVEMGLNGYTGTTFNTYLNGVLSDTFVATGSYRFDGLGDGDILAVQAIPEPSSRGLFALAGILLLVWAKAGKQRSAPVPPAPDHTPFDRFPGSEN
jgi:dienelactone hydrolase